MEPTVFKFRPEDVFPLTDPLSVPLLRLMAATNDVLHLQKLVLSQLAEEPQTDAGKLTKDGKLGYLFRIFCGHLHEAASAFRNLDCECKKQVDGMIARDDGVKSLFKKLRRVFNDLSEQGLLRALEAIRNRAFHYDAKDFADSLHLDWPDAKFVVADMAGASRYTFTDQILTRRTIEAVGGIKNYQSKVVGQTIDIAGTLAQAVDYLLLAVLDKDGSYRKTLREKPS